MYLMKGGYNEFFTTMDGAYQARRSPSPRHARVVADSIRQDLCFGAYTRMHDDAHVPQLKVCRSRAPLTSSASVLSC